jgi:manganese transport protein
MDVLIKRLRAFTNHWTKKDAPVLGALEVFRYIGPGLLVTVGFIDPGNWAANISAGALFGYELLWVITLSTIMLIVLQHNAAHLGIVTGLCLAEAATAFLRLSVAWPAIASAVLASVSTAVAELLGAAIGLKILFHIPIRVGAALTASVVLVLLLRNTYKRIESIIIGLVSVIGLAFIYELGVVQVDWSAAVRGWVTPTLPNGSVLLTLSVLGAVVMPHNLFLHSEIIQSRQWNLTDEATMSRQLKYEFIDTLLAMGVGWAINSAMIITAAVTFFVAHTQVSDLAQASSTLAPLVGHFASLVFALALLCAGVASTITAGIAGGSIFAGLFHEPFDIHDKHSRTGVIGVFVLALAVILLLDDVFRGLILSQAALSMQLPVTIFLLIALTSSKKIMGRHANPRSTKIVLYCFGAIVTGLNVLLLVDLVRGGW